MKMGEATIDKISDRAHRQRAVVTALMDADRALSPVEIAEMTGLKGPNVRQAVLQMKENGLLIQPEDGLYALPEWASRYVSLNNNGDEELAKRKADARRNAGIVVRDTNSGSVWFRIPFPDYMVVETPMTVRIEADANDPDFEKLREHFAGSGP